MDKIKGKWHNEARANEARAIYRKRLEETRHKYGNWIPFGYNLELLKTKK